MNRRALLLSAAALAIAAGPACSQAVFDKAEKPIPFEFFHGNRIVLQGAINGRATEILLDSGAGLSCLDKAFADSIGVKAVTTIPLKGVAGTVQAGYGVGVTFSVGGFEQKGVNVLILDLSPIANQIGHPIPAVLGRSVFDAAVVDIDFPKRLIAFRDPARFTPPAGAVTLALTPTPSDPGTRDVPVSLEGRAPVMAGFDLGNGDALIVSKAYGDSEQLLKDRPSSTEMSGGVGGLKVRSVATFRRLTIASFEFQDVPASLNRGEGELPAKGLNVGIDVWKRFHLMIDYTHGQLSLIPDAQAMAAPYRKNRAGLATRPDGDHLTVTHVAAGSPAEAEGWKVGEQIRAVNGEPVGPKFLRGDSFLWPMGAAGTTVELTMADGSTRRLTLKDYF